MGLNRKGYMLVEIVLASVLAMGIAYYLLNLTYKFKNTNDDIYQSIYYEHDKILITRNIMSDLEYGIINEYTSNASSITFTLLKGDVSSKRRLAIVKDSDGTFVKYGKYEDDDFDIEDISYYEKKITAQLVGDLIVTSTLDSKLVLITIPISSLYDDENYDIKLFINKE